MENFGKLSQKDLVQLNEAERAVEEAELSKQLANFEEKTRLNADFDEETKAAILNSLEVTHKEYRNDTLDRSRYYQDLSLHDRIKMFLINRIEKNVLSKKHIDPKRDSFVIEFLKEIALVHE